MAEQPNTKRYVILRDGGVMKIWDTRAERCIVYTGEGSEPVQIPGQSLHSMLKFHPYADSIVESDTLPSTSILQE